MTAIDAIRAYCVAENPEVPVAFATQEPCFAYARREWLEADEEDREAVAEAWAEVASRWADAETADVRPIKVITDAYGTAGPDIFSSAAELYRLVAELNDCGRPYSPGCWPEEGRDFEFLRVDGPAEIDRWEYEGNDCSRIRDLSADEDALADAIEEAVHRHPQAYAEPDEASGTLTVYGADSALIDDIADILSKED